MFHKSDSPWPARLPDLSLLDYFLWDCGAVKEVFEEKPTMILYLKDVVACETLQAVAEISPLEFAHVYKMEVNLNKHLSARETSEFS